MSHLRRPIPALLGSALLLAGLLALPARAADEYKLGPDSQPQAGVPKGVVTKYTFKSTRIFPGTVREYQVYVPAQYTKEQPACVMVFQDGGGFASEKGNFRATIVMDNLIHRKQMPVTVGVFVNPGVIPTPSGAVASPKPGDKSNPPDAPPAHPRYNRSYEYDSPTDLYARFLLEELLPDITANHVRKVGDAEEKGLNLTTEATGRGICGSSSGGIAAFTAAWERPDAFSRVVSFIGSFTNLRGGNDYPSLIRKTEPKPIRVFLQDGSADLDIYSGSWFIGNQDMAAALKFAGYEHQFVVGTEGHNGKHGGAILPDALRYIWKDYPRPPAAGAMSGVDKRNVMGILVPGQGWELVSEGHKFSEGPTADADGTVYFADGGQQKIFKVTPEGKVSVFCDAEGGCDGMMMGPNGRLYVNANKSNQVVTYDVRTGQRAVVASEFPSNNDLVVSHKGAVYVTDHKARQVWYIPPEGGAKRVVDTGLEFPNGIILTPDQTQLIVADMKGPGLYLFSIKPDGSLADKTLYYYAQLPVNKGTSGADGLAMDAEGNLYAATHLGLQVFDQAGRVTGIIPGPVPGRRPSNVDFGGPGNAYLYVTNGDKVFRRKTQTKGVLFFQAPILTPTPRL